MSKNYYPPMHTAEHILNQTMLRYFTKERSFSAHLEKKKSKCDYHFDRNLTDKEINFLEEKVNNEIAKNHDVIESFMHVDEAKNYFNLSKLPEDAGDNLRVIKVGDYDSCLCIGNHVKNTSEIGKFTIVSTSYDKEILRVRFKLENIIEE